MRPSLGARARMTPQTNSVYPTTRRYSFDGTRNDSWDDSGKTLAKATKSRRWSRWKSRWTCRVTLSVPKRAKFKPRNKDNVTSTRFAILLRSHRASRLEREREAETRGRRENWVVNPPRIWMITTARMRVLTSPHVLSRSMSSVDILSSNLNRHSGAARKRSPSSRTTLSNAHFRYTQSKGDLLISATNKSSWSYQVQVVVQELNGKLIDPQTSEVEQDHAYEQHLLFKRELRHIVRINWFEREEKVAETRSHVKYKSVERERERRG